MLVGQARVRGMQHRAKAGDDKEQLEMTMGVPGERGHPVARAHTQPCQHVRCLRHPAKATGIIIAPQWLVDIARDDLARGVRGGGEADNVDDGQIAALH